ncbi:hypothetical protein D9756_004024 [Leucocoprinus leucothites]|uniref:Uncharacterized protein n=1 Tax=Leucocoprinus leucothites TaxID=201217 RepID=A0A8H5G0Q0_9AGAR|nr:hypothetical protein D9756_004024 [Leucoagaricus leucothites]
MSSQAKIRRRHFELPTMQSLRAQAVDSLNSKSKRSDKNGGFDKKNKSKFLAEMANNTNVASARRPPAECQYVFL